MGTDEQLAQLLALSRQLEASLVEIVIQLFHTRVHRLGPTTARGSAQGMAHTPSKCTFPDHIAHVRARQRDLQVDLGLLDSEAEVRAFGPLLLQLFLCLLRTAARHVSAGHMIADG
eukprot:2368072-Rhodomonas_salina.5